MLMHTPRRILGRLHREERGQIAWAFILLTLVVFMFFALAFDAGLWFFDHRTAQNQVDAAAHAGAFALPDEDTAYDTAYAWLEEDNGGDLTGLECVDSEGSYNVRVKDDDGDGFHDWVETCVRRDSSVVFSALSNVTGIKISARAAASMFEIPLPYSLMAMDEGACPGLNLSGQAHVVISGVDGGEAGQTYTRSGCTDPQGALRVNDNDNAALISGGNAVVGDWNTGDNVEPEPHAEFWIPDPFEDLDQPTGTGLPTFNTGNINGNVTIQPGIYTNTIRVGNGDQLTLEPGIYILKGGIDQTGGTITSALPGGDPREVLLFATCNNTPCDGSRAPDLAFEGGSLQLKGHSGYRNILFWIDRTTKHNPGGSTLSLTGDGDLQLEGMSYTIGSHVHISGQGDADLTLNMSFIADTFDISGQGNITIQYDPVFAPVTREIALVE